MPFHPFLDFIGSPYFRFGFLVLFFKGIPQFVNLGKVNRKTLGLNTSKGIHTLHKETEGLLQASHLFGLVVTKSDCIDGVFATIISQFALGNTDATFQEIEGVLAILVFPIHHSREELVHLVIVTDYSELAIGVELQADFLVIVDDVSAQASIPTPVRGPLCLSVMPSCTEASPTSFKVSLVSHKPDSFVVGKFIPSIREFLAFAIPQEADGVVFAILAVAYRSSLDFVSITMGLQAGSFVVDCYIVVSFRRLVQLVSFAPFTDFVNPLCRFNGIPRCSDVRGNLRERSINQFPSGTDMLRKVHIRAMVIFLPRQKFGRIGRANPGIVMAVGNPLAIKVGRFGVLDSAGHSTPDEGVNCGRTHRDNDLRLEFRNKPVQSFATAIRSRFLVLDTMAGENVSEPSGFQEIIRKTPLALQVPEPIVHLVEKDRFAIVTLVATGMVTEN